MKAESRKRYNAIKRIADKNNYRIALRGYGLYKDYKVVIGIALAPAGSGITAKCDINDELQSDYAAGYDCANSDSFSGTPQSLEIESNKIEDIEGIPDSANPDKLNYNIDY